MIGPMRTRYSEDEVAVRDAFFDFFANECPTTTVRAAAEGTGFDPALWSSLAAMGAPGMALPESLGGAGAALLHLQRRRPGAAACEMSASSEVAGERTF